MASWRVASSLLVLRSQYDELFPGRSKASDGTIGDAAHQARVSDHNPDVGGVVRALDITNDPGHGLDTNVEVQRLAASRDPRIKYLICNHKIWQPSNGWQPYAGPDPHTSHMHISVVADRRADDTTPWDIGPKENTEIVKAGTTWNVRAEPNVSSPIFGQVVGGQSYPTVKLENGWRQISFHGMIGYVSNSAWVGVPTDNHTEAVKPGQWNVRTGPGLGYPTRDGVVVGGQVFVTKVVVGGWREIQFRGATGYVGPKAW